MEGRTAYNSIHPKYILDIKAIDYMYSIINSDIDEEIKLRFKNQYEDLLKCLKNQNIMI